MLDKVGLRMSVGPLDGEPVPCEIEGNGRERRPDPTGLAPLPAGRRPRSGCGSMIPTGAGLVVPAYSGWPEVDGQTQIFELYFAQPNALQANPQGRVDRRRGGTGPAPGRRGGDLAVLGSAGGGRSGRVPTGRSVRRRHVPRAGSGPRAHHAVHRWDVPGAAPRRHLAPDPGGSGAPSSPPLSGGGCGTAWSSIATAAMPTTNSSSSSPGGWPRGWRTWPRRSDPSIPTEGAAVRLWPGP